MTSLNTKLVLNAFDSILPTLDKLSSKLVYSLLLVLGTTIHVNGQSSEPASPSHIWFDTIIGTENSGIINGTRYKMDFFSAKTNPFYATGESVGTVVYDQQRYQVSLLYDCYKDEIIVKHFAKSGLGWFIQLDKKLVSEFVINGDVFKNYNGNFYQTLFESEKFSVVSKRSKFHRVTGNIHNYEENSDYFLIDSGNWSRFWSISKLKSLFTSKEDKEKLKAFISINKIKNKDLSDENVFKASAFVNSLLTKKGI